MATQTYAAARWLFLRMLGLVYFCAYASLVPQIAGLAGPNGIVPSGSSDAVLRGVCIAGSVLGVALVAGVAPLAIVPALWAGYLWLSNACGEFLSFQWDALLLEAGLLAILVAPAVWRDRAVNAIDPPRVARWLMVWLVFRLMFGSGAVKLASGDPTWRDLTAMTFHYETQPIPNPVAYYAHHLPAILNKMSTAATIAIELVAPLLMLGPRRLRLLAAVLLIGLQVLIAVTGNFAFFNLLSIALCVWLVDDGAIQRVARVFGRGGQKLAQDFSPAIAAPGHAHPERVEGGARPVRGWMSIAAAVVIVPVSLLHFTSSLGLAIPGWQLAVPIAEVVAPLRSVNSYGLFAVMTTTRPEIIVEGSNDGVTWSAYEFPYKPGDLARRPPWVAPHQPRLDWQMWFAALGTYQENVWFQNLCVRLLQASPEVLGLLARDPFNGHPPKYVRAELFRYRFSAAGSHDWWTRERLGDYAPVLSLR